MKKQLTTAVVLLMLLSGKVATADNCLAEAELAKHKQLLHRIELMQKFEYYNMVKYFDEVSRLKADQLAKKYNVTVDDLCTIFSIESGGNPKKYNPVSGAIGIIQWLPSTARNFGVTTKDIKNMSTLDQLYLAEQYLDFFQPKDNYNNIWNLYFAVFQPSAMGKPDNYIIGKEGSAAAVNNPGVTRAHKDDNVLTVADVKAFCS